MKKVLLDTSAYRALRRGDHRVREVMEEADHVYLNPVILGELYCGHERGSSLEKNRKELEEFLESGLAEVLPIDAETSVRYSLLFGYLRKAGTPVSPNDLWVGASAMQHGLELITFDTDFLRTPHIFVHHFDAQPS